MPHEVLDVDGCIRVEPALARVREVRRRPAPPGDETGDCFKFTDALRDLAAARGVDFRYGVQIKGLIADGDRIVGVATNTGTVAADAYVVALGSHSPLLLKSPRHRPAGLSGQGLLADRADHRPGGRARSTVMDEIPQVAITRLGDRIRVGGMAELDGYSTTLHASRRAALEHVVTDFYAGGGDATKAPSGPATGR